MQDNLSKTYDEAIEKINSATELPKLDELFLELFGKNGIITLIPKNFPTLPKEELKVIAPLFSKVKNQLEDAINERRLRIKEEGYKKLEDEKLDLTPEIASPGARNDEKTPLPGYLHPSTVFEKEISELFAKIGFQRFDAPHIDTDYYNFEVLNIPPEHPARDLWDTLYIADPDKYGYKPGELLLRTHTSNAQVRALKEHGVPLRMMIIDRCFRYENLDARHDHTFQQFEIVYVDKKVSMANLQYLSEYFLKNIFGSEIKARLRPKYFPFVEPGAGVDGLCIFCKGEGCKVCGGVGWLELAGAGMIHPTVLKNAGIDPNEYSGIAWGFGPDRLAILKYGLTDIRVLRSGDLKALNELGGKIALANK
jgi:phenylalanyl-tRNA synthetase alpha chain